MNKDELKQWLIDEFGFTYKTNYGNGHIGALEAYIGKHGFSRNAPLKLTLYIDSLTVDSFRISKKRPDLRCDEVRTAIEALIVRAKHREELHAAYRARIAKSVEDAEAVTE